LRFRFETAGWAEVLLTPRSNDRGRDIIATKPGIGSIRIIDQAKKFAPHRKIAANDVRALLGVLAAQPNVSKGIVTTTSQFAPGILDDEDLKRFMPYRLELKDGKQLREWLLSLAPRHVA
jgi:restriction system protein